MQIKENLIAVTGYTVAGMALAYTAASLTLCLSPSMAEHAFGMLSMQNRMVPPFADLRAITALAGCSADIDHVMRGISAGCDPYGRSGGLGYPPMIFKLARSIGASGSWTGPAAMFCGFLFVAIILRDIKHSGLIKRHQAWLLAAILIAFPTQLGLERMNIDISIFIGLRLLAWIRGADKQDGIESWLAKSLSFWLALLLGGAKVYPSLGILLWIGFEYVLKRKRKGIDPWIAAGAITGALTAIPWIQSGDKYASPPISITSHGLVSGRDGETGAMLISLVSIAFVYIGYTYISKQVKGNDRLTAVEKPLTSSSRNDEGEWSWIVLCLGTWIASYCLTTSFDYRFIFVYPFLIGLTADASKGTELDSKTKAAGVAIILLIIAYMYSPLTYMATEGLRYEATSMEGWMHSPMPMLVKYGSAGLSRLLDTIGLPLTTGCAIGYIYKRRMLGKRTGTLRL